MTKISNENSKTSVLPSIRVDKPNKTAGKCSKTDLKGLCNEVANSILKQSEEMTKQGNGDHQTLDLDSVVEIFNNSQPLEPAIVLIDSILKSMPENAEKLVELANKTASVTSFINSEKNKEFIKKNYEKKAFAQLNKKLKLLKKSCHSAQSKNKISIQANKNNAFYDTVLEINKVAEARFSQATIAGTSASIPGKGGATTPLQIEDLKNKISRHGWDLSAPRINLYLMPDNNYTSWDNRRLWALKKIVEESPEKSIKIPVRIYSVKEKTKAKDIKNFHDRLTETRDRDTETASEEVNAFRKVLLSEDLEQTPAELPGSHLHLILMRIYRDAGKPVGAQYSENRQIDGFKGPVVFGYTSTVIRQPSS